MAAPYTIEFFSRKRRKSHELVHYFRIRAANGEIVTQSQGYSRAIDRDDSARRLRAGLIEAEIVEVGT